VFLSLHTKLIDLIVQDLVSYDEDEEYEDPKQLFAADEKNSALAVGYKSDRSFVVRGDKIGVFRHTDDDNLGMSSYTCF